MELEQPKENLAETHSVCPKCHGDGYIRWRDENGYEFAEECSCGIRKKRIMHERRTPSGCVG